MNEDDLPKLKGLPADLHQMVAVSDAVNRDPHDFSRPWEDDAERTAVLTKMQTLARAKLAAYNAGCYGCSGSASCACSEAWDGCCCGCSPGRGGVRKLLRLPLRCPCWMRI